MRLYIEIKDDKATFFLELLKNFPFVKIRETPVQSPAGSISFKTKRKKVSEVEQHSGLKAEIAEAVEELKLVLEGKKKARNAEDFLNGL